MIQGNIEGFEIRTSLHDGEIEFREVIEDGDPDSPFRDRLSIDGGVTKSVSVKSKLGKVPMAVFPMELRESQLPNETSEMRGGADGSDELLEGDTRLGFDTMVKQGRGYIVPVTADKTDSRSISGRSPCTMVEMAEDDEEDVFWAFLCNGMFPGRVALHCL
jgi:hypothetical protein